MGQDQEHQQPPFAASVYARELEIAERLGRKAGSLALRIRSGDAGLEVEMKAGDEPVTVADRAASDLIVGGLEAAFPDDVIVSEEAPFDEQHLAAPRVWFIDPIDGTKDFIRGEDGFSVMIGLAVDHVPVVGVVYQPMGDRLFAAAPDVGAWFVAPGVAPRKIEVSDIGDVTAIRLVASKSHRDDTIDRVKSALGVSDELNIGSVGLKLGLISLAERDLYVNPSPKCKVWDTAAPEAILRAAGGRLTDANGEALRYDTVDAQHRQGLVASNGHVHDAVINKLAPLFGRTS